MTMRSDVGASGGFLNGQKVKAKGCGSKPATKPPRTNKPAKCKA